MIGPQLSITNGALAGFALCFLALFALVAAGLYDFHRLDTERRDRNRQVNQAFLTNCRNREREINRINRRLGLPPTGVRCSQLPVFK